MMDSKNDSVRDRFFLVVIFLLVLIMALRLPFDTDFWWHVRAGQDTVALGRPVLTDLYSYTRLGADWVNHSWLSQVIFYLIYKWFSLPGVMVLVAFMAALSIFLIDKTMRGPLLLNAFLLVLTVLISAVIWTPRPQLFTFLFLAIEQYLLYHYQKTGDTKVLIVLLVLFVVWSNLHAGFSLGILFLALWLAGHWVDRIFDVQIPFGLGKIDLIEIGLLAFSSLVVMINPNGLNVWRVQFDTISVSVLQDLIPEWASPNFHELLQQPFLWAILLVVFFGLSVPKRVETAKILPLLFFGYLGFLARRNYGPFAIVVSPVLSELVLDFYDTRLKDSLLIRKFKLPSSTTTLHPKVTKSINLLIVSLLGLVLIAKFVYLSSPVVMSFYEAQLYPQKAVQWLKENPIAGNGLNEYAWGGYLLWHLPDNRVFVDGRTDLYGDEIIVDWLNLVSAADDWPDALGSYQLEWVFLEKTRPLNALLLEQDWEKVYEDEVCVIIQATR